MLILALDALIKNALSEDIHTGDITTESICPPGRMARARLVAKEPQILAGIAVAERVFRLLDPNVLFRSLTPDGSNLVVGDIIAEIEGDAALLLQGERVALNLLQRMGGVATLTGRYVAAVAGTGARIVDTRKTAPGLRMLDKYAVRVGGGSNHRGGLYDGVLIKENHIAVAGGIAAAISCARGAVPHTTKIEVEIERLDQIAEALAAGADIIMLDNMDLTAIREAVRFIGGKALVEASGGVNLETVRAVAESGVDLISVGALTHSVPAVDISMLLEVA